MSTSEEFKKHGIVPDVVTKAPEKRAKVVFDSGVESNLGNVLTPTQVQHPPKVTWEAEAGKLYSLIMTDPDAPSRKDPKLRVMVTTGSLVVNIPGTELDKGDVLSEYVGVGPPQDTGMHRYVFLIYQQKSKINDPEHGHLTNRSEGPTNGDKCVPVANGTISTAVSGMPSAIAEQTRPIERNLPGRSRICVGRHPQRQMTEIKAEMGRSQVKKNGDGKGSDKEKWKNRESASGFLDEVFAMGRRLKKVKEEKEKRSEEKKKRSEKG
uniref:Phosphatidylethanolamine-binding protein n=1 Tax=Globodera pallida TaxID=36090 RepID=A0A183CKV0_GLOPA